MKKILLTLLLGAFMICSTGCADLVWWLLSDTEEDTQAEEGYETEDYDTGDSDIYSDGWETVHYEWEYGSASWTYDLSIPVGEVERYRDMERTPEQYYSQYADYVDHEDDDEYLRALADKFIEAAEGEGWNKDEAVNLAIAFVQSLEYIPEDEDALYDYPKYPLETLYDKGGDCEDTSILLISLLREMDYGCALIAYDDHMGVGILGEDGMEGRYYEIDGNRYYYIETTDKDWEIGEIPDDYIDRKAQLKVY